MNHLLEEHVMHAACAEFIWPITISPLQLDRIAASLRPSPATSSLVVQYYYNTEFARFLHCILHAPHICMHSNRPVIICFCLNPGRERLSLKLTVYIIYPYNRDRSRRDFCMQMWKAATDLARNVRLIR